MINQHSKSLRDAVSEIVILMSEKSILQHELENERGRLELQSKAHDETVAELIAALRKSVEIVEMFSDPDGYISKFDWVRVQASLDQSRAALKDK